MRYRTRNGKPIGDLGDISSFSKATSSLSSVMNRQHPIWGVFIGFTTYLLSMAAFISRCILRIRIGERTFGLFTILLLFFFIWFLKVYQEALQGVQGEFNLIENGLFFDALSFMIEIFVALPQAIYNLLLGKVSTSTQLSNEVLGFSLIVLIISITQLLEVYSRKKREVVIHSFYRGDSLLFGWLEGQTYFKKNITKTHIWMIIEPLFVLVIAWMIDLFLGWSEVAFTLTVSGICLFLEEYRFYSENRQFELDLIDNQLDASYTASLQNQLNQTREFEKTESLPNRVSLTSHSDSSQNSSKMKRQRRKSFYRANIY